MTSATLAAGSEAGRRCAAMSKRCHSSQNPAGTSEGHSPLAMSSVSSDGNSGAPVNTSANRVKTLGHALGGNFEREDHRRMSLREGRPRARRRPNRRPFGTSIEKGALQAQDWPSLSRDWPNQTESWSIVRHNNAEADRHRPRPKWERATRFRSCASRGRGRGATASADQVRVTFTTLTTCPVGSTDGPHGCRGKIVSSEPKYPRTEKRRQQPVATSGGGEGGPGDAQTMKWAVTDTNSAPRGSS